MGCAIVLYRRFELVLEAVVMATPLIEGRLVVDRRAKLHLAVWDAAR